MQGIPAGKSVRYKKQRANAVSRLTAQHLMGIRVIRKTRKNWFLTPKQHRSLKEFLKCVQTVWKLEKYAMCWQKKIYLHQAYICPNDLVQTFSAVTAEKGCICTEQKYPAYLSVSPCLSSREPELLRVFIRGIEVYEKPEKYSQQREIQSSSTMRSSCRSKMVCLR